VRSHHALFRYSLLSLHTLTHAAPPCLFFTLHPPPLFPLFPYTTLFRSLPVQWRARRFQRRPLLLPVQQPRSAKPDRTQLAEQSRSEEHTSELQSPDHLVCRLLLEKKKTKHI